MTFRLATPADLPEVRAALADAPRIALDTEFHAERRYLPQLYLVQIRLPDGATWILDPLDAAVLELLAESLAGPDWIVHGGQQDLRVLGPICGRPARVYDTQVGAALAGARYPASYSEIAHRWLGVDLDKGETLSDWSRRPLTAEQLLYAGTDVEDLLRLWDLLAAEAADRGRADLLEAACAEVATQALAPQKADWRRLSGISSLEPRSAAALGNLLVWREQTAELLDQPARQIVPDPVLADLARRLPRTRGALLANRRMSKALVRDFGDDLVAAIAAALDLVPSELPVVIRPGSAEAVRVAVLSAVGDLLSVRGGWGAGLVLPRLLLEDVALSPPPDRAALAAALGPWRDRVAGDDLYRFLDGSDAIIWQDRSPRLRG